jgi:hypothetical protein
MPEYDFAQRTKSIPVRPNDKISDGEIPGHRRVRTSRTSCRVPTSQIADISTFFEHTADNFVTEY